jgi:E3 ubiquitin-protein ligase HECTD1
MAADIATKTCFFSACDGTRDGIDKDGVLFYLGTKGGGQGYGNPGEEGGLVKCTKSSQGVGEPSQFVDHKSGRGSSNTKAQPNSFMSVDLQLCRVSNMTKYVLRHGYSSGGGNCRLLHWRLQGSEDGAAWTDIDVQDHAQSPLPNAAYSTAAFDIPAGPGTEWKHLRLRQTGKNSNGTDYLVCAGLEVYGTVGLYRPKPTKSAGFNQKVNRSAPTSADEAEADGAGAGAAKEGGSGC